MKPRNHQACSKPVIKHKRIIDKITLSQLIKESGPKVMIEIIGSRLGMYLKLPMSRRKLRQRCSLSYRFTVDKSYRFSRM